MAFAITEPDAGTNSHNITTTARRDGDEWVLNGRKIYISGVDEADNVLVVARTEDAKTGKLKPCLFVVPTDAEGFECTPIPMEIVSPEQQFQVFIDDVRLPADALVGDEDGGLVQLFAGLNPERIMAASFSTGLARFALDKAAAYAKERDGLQGARSAPTRPSRTRWRSRKIEIELARLMTQKAAALYDAGDDMGAGEAANMAKYAAAEAACDAADRAVQTHGGNGITQEYGMAGLLVAARAGRIAPVSREMILNFVGMHSPGPAEVLLTARSDPAPWTCDAAEASNGLPLTRKEHMTELVHYGVATGSPRSRSTRRTTATRCPGSWSPSCSTGSTGPRPTTTSRSC